MNTIWQNIIRFAVLMLLQLLVLNNVYLGGYITPYLYVLFVLMLPTNTPRPAMLLLAFASGLCVDIFDNMLGFHSFAATLLGFCRITFADKILTRGEQIDIDTPSIHSVGVSQLAGYLLLMFFIYNFAFFFLEIFSFEDFWRILLSSVLSTVVVWVLAMLYQSLFLRKK